MDRVHAKCAENGARSVMKRNTSNGMEEQSYLNLDLQDALEQLWYEDNAPKSSIVIVPNYKGRTVLQYA